MRLHLSESKRALQSSLVFSSLLLKRTTILYQLKKLYEKSNYINIVKSAHEFLFL
jgi:hypothetical protein